ncbi:glycosyltransferase 87 family protein [Amycolatopsis sp. CA-230715]|uniref:glycosyltransferase 87 family protein n=1 Tax=Amycolatopsis sp. CA-230715 TaxID=2745196 RepID=UPI0020B248D9|nr:glycosyltransferase 87 family protein [Amycolatopsis sp. CA-230715]
MTGETTLDETRRPARFRPPPRTLDAAFFLFAFGYALITALTNEFYGFRVWGNFAAAGYGLGLVLTIAELVAARRGLVLPRLLASRWTPIALAAVLAMLVPLAVLVVRRLTGVDWLITPWSWAAQPEVWVIERSASLLLDHGTPYVDVLSLDRPPEVNDYTPYGPVMTVFGLPRALFGGTPVTDALTDARLMFALCVCLCLWGTWRLLGRPRITVAAAQLTAVFPLTALIWSTSGPDLAIFGLFVLALALAAARRPVLAGVLAGAVVSAKLIVASAVVVLAVFVFARLGSRAFGRFAATAIGLCVVLNLPVFLADPGAFVEHVIRFPTGSGVVVSPAGSPFPGYLIAGLGTAGKIAAFALLGMAALAIGAWVLLRPPATGSDAVLRIVVGLCAQTMLAPATRFGYLVYPIALLGVLLVFREHERAKPSAVTSS